MPFPTPEPQNDGRIEVMVAQYLEQHPHLMRKDVFLPFQAGWYARSEAAQLRTLETGAYADPDTATLKDHFELIVNQGRRFFNMSMKARDLIAQLEREVTGYRIQISALHSNPDDAPLYRKISTQRKALKAANKFIEKQAGELALAQQRLADQELSE